MARPVGCRSPCGVRVEIKKPVGGARSPDRARRRQGDEAVDHESARNSVELIHAVHCWTGWGESAIPIRDDDRLRDLFGASKGNALLSELKDLYDAFYLSEARLVSKDMAEMADRCARDFRLKHPTVPEEVVRALVWCYTFDYR